MDKAIMIEEGSLTGVIKSDGVLKGSMVVPSEIVTGSETFDITITSSADSSGNITYTSSDVFDDILAAARDNTQVRLITPDNKYCLLDYIPDSDAGALFFNEDPVFANDGSYVSGSYWVIYSDNKVDRSDKFMVKGLPSYSTDEDDGKVLRVSAISGVDWATPAVTKIESLDKDNPKNLEGLEDGVYILQGYITLASGLSTFECNNELACVRNVDGRMYVWMFDPHLNCIIRYEIRNGGVITDYFNLNDLHNSFVRFDNGQILSDKQQKQARENIGAGTSNFGGSYNDLTDVPITKIESLDESNIKTLRGLEDGPYVLSGYFTPYTGADSTFIFDPPAIASINSTDSATHVQILEPYNNQIQHLVITDTTCESSYVLLNDIAKSASEIGDLSTLTTTAKDTLVDAINEAASDNTFTVDAYVGLDATDITVNKTPAEIYEAYTKGLIVTVNLRSDTQGIPLNKVNLKLSGIDKDNDKYYIKFCNLVRDNIPMSFILYWNNAKWVYGRDYIASYHYLENNYVPFDYGTMHAGRILGVDSDGIVTTMDPAGSVIPSVTASDNGKVLQVVNGAWAAVTSSGGSGGSITAIEF